MDKEIIKKIYNDIFLYIQHSNIDLFLCGGASNKSYVSNRDQLRKRLEKDKKLSIFYPEDMFMELLSRKKYDLFTFFLSCFSIYLTGPCIIKLLSFLYFF